MGRIPIDEIAYKVFIATFFRGDQMPAFKKRTGKVWKTVITKTEDKKGMGRDQKSIWINDER